jgi:leucine dehydrogenase
MKAIICIDSTKRGPALGGCRFISYANLNSALTDVTRLARGMTFKAALANLPLGGGKSVIIKPDHIADRPALFHAFGRFVNELGGRYITAVDSGTTVDDMNEILKISPYCASGKVANGFGLGDPSPCTARGTFAGLRAAVKHKLGKSSVNGLRVAIQGLGHVGFDLARFLHADGAHLIVTDTHASVVQRAVQELKAEAVEPADIFKVDCDVFSPCALGGILNDQSIPQLKCAIIAGAANNQLQKPEHGDQLHQKGILYAPDYVINAGGLIYALAEYSHGSEELAFEKAEEIYNTLYELFERSKNQNRPTSVMADEMAMEKVA